MGCKLDSAVTGLFLMKTNVEKGQKQCGIPFIPKRQFNCDSLINILLEFSLNERVLAEFMAAVFYIPIANGFSILHFNLRLINGATVIIIGGVMSLHLLIFS